MLRRIFLSALPIGFLLLFACADSNVPTPDPATNPDNCRLSKILYDSETSPVYDAYTYNPDGTVAKIEQYSNGRVVGGMSFTYTNGLLTRQQTQGGGSVVYTYAGTDFYQYTGCQ
jgi:hypothetical protein